jgi:hypothetical protein
MLACTADNSYDLLTQQNLLSLTKIATMSTLILLPQFRDSLIKRLQRKHNIKDGEANSSTSSTTFMQATYTILVQDYDL